MLADKITEDDEEDILAELDAITAEVVQLKVILLLIIDLSQIEAKIERLPDVPQTEMPAFEEGSATESVKTGSPEKAYEEEPQMLAA